MSLFFTRELLSSLPVRIMVQDDTFYPFYGGGSKARKLKNFIEDAAKKGSNAIVTAGSASSNHAKAVALACAEVGWSCTIVIHDEENYNKGNLLLMKLAGARLVFARLSEVGPVMDQEMARYHDRGETPYYVYGGGHGLPGYLAFYVAAKEFLKSYPSFLPDYVVHASGTGGTQAGLLVGFNEASPKTKVIGISVARDQGRGLSVLRQSCDELCKSMSLPPVPDDKLWFSDEWVGEGYGAVYPELIGTIKQFCSQSGLVTDPIYTGKALHGMRVMIERGDIPAGSRVLFWHTGGLTNIFEHTKSLLL